MADIRFEQVVFQQENKDEIDEVCKQYKILLGKCASDTVFQLSHFDLLSKGYDLYDYIYNDDISSTTLKKLKEFIDEVKAVIDSEDFINLKEAAKIASQVISKNI